MNYPGKYITAILLIFFMLSSSCRTLETVEWQEGDPPPRTGCGAFKKDYEKWFACMQASSKKWEDAENARGKVSTGDSYRDGDDKMTEKTVCWATFCKPFKLRKYDPTTVARIKNNAPAIALVLFIGIVFGVWLPVP